MFCDKCGAQIPDGSTFCSSCGQPLAQSVDTSQNYGAYNNNNYGSYGNNAGQPSQPYGNNMGQPSQQYGNNMGQQPYGNNMGQPSQPYDSTNFGKADNKKTVNIIIAVVACVLIAAVAFGIVKKKQKDQLTLRTNLNTAIHAMDDEIIIGKRAYGVYESYLGSLVPIGEYNVQNNNFNTVDECLSKVLDVKASSDYSDDIGKLLDSYTVVNHILFKQIYVDESNADSLYDMTDFKNALNDYDAAKESVRTTMYNNMKPKHKKISDEKKEELKGEAYVLFETIGDAAQDFINGDANADVFALADISGDAGVNINDEMPYCTAYVNYKIYGSGDDITGVDLIYYDIETGYCIKLSDDGINEDEEELDSYLAYTDIDISGLYSDL